MIDVLRSRRTVWRAVLVSPLLLVSLACEDDSNPPPQTALPGNAPVESTGTGDTAGADPVEPSSPQETPPPNPDAGADP